VNLVYEVILWIAEIVVQILVSLSVIL
jgi:hypothetical protein